MAGRRARFRQADIARSLRAAADAGFRVTGYEIDPSTGKIAIRLAVATPVELEGANEWDEVLQ